MPNCTACRSESLNPRIDVSFLLEFVNEGYQLDLVPNPNFSCLYSQCNCKISTYNTHFEPYCLCIIFENVCFWAVFDVSCQLLYFKFLVFYRFFRFSGEVFRFFQNFQFFRFAISIITTLHSSITCQL